MHSIVEKEFYIGVTKMLHKTQLSCSITIWLRCIGHSFN